jgi:predicted lactoylglutathione lyase
VSIVAAAVRRVHEPPPTEEIMTTTNPRKIFVNIAVTDLDRSVAFWKKLGFSFNAQFTDQAAACMVLSDDAYVMLLVKDRFKDFARKPLCDSTQSTEALFCLSATSKAEVDQLVRTAVESGGTPAADRQDHGFMYGWSFYDPDGHHWEVAWMDPKAITS